MALFVPDDRPTNNANSGIVFKREFSGRTATSIVPWATYRTCYINQIMRGLGFDEGWQEWWEAEYPEAI